jgi:hypothetical protein
MNFKTTYFLFGLLVLVLVVFGFALWMNPGKEDTSTYVLREMHSRSAPLTDTDITRVEIERARPSAEKIVFVKDPLTKQWSIAEPLACRADRSAVENLVRDVYNARRDPHSEPSNDPKQYGLEPPAEVITLVKESEPRREARLLVGEVGPGKETAVIYVASAERPREVLAVQKSSLAAVLNPLNDFRNRDLLSPSSSDIQSVALSEGKKKVELKKSGDNWVYLDPPYGRAEETGSTGPAVPGKAPDGVQPLLTEISQLRVASASDFVADHVKDLAKFHLDKDVLKIAIDRTEEISTNEEGQKERKTSHHVLVVGVSRKVEKPEEKKAEEKKGEGKPTPPPIPDQYYAMLDDDGSVVKVSAQSIEPFRKLLDDTGALRDRNLVDTGGFKKPDAIDVKNSNGLLEFRRGNEPGKEWTLYRDGGETAHAVDGQAVQALVSLLTQKNVVTEFRDAEQKKKLGLDNPDAPVVKVWLDGIAADKDKDKDKDGEKEKIKEKKETKPKLKDPNKPSVELRFGNTEGGLVAVERKFAGEDKGAIVLVPDRIRLQVVEGPLAYLDRTLPPFAALAFDPAKDVTKVVIERGATTTEVARAKADAPWQIIKPEAQKDRTADALAVEEILRDLNGLRAEKLVTEKANEKQLGEYDLRPPKTKVTITLTRDGKPQTFEYDFGKEAAGQNGVYAKQGNSDTVYVVAASKLAVLDRELQDPKVFSFDPSKVRELKLTGWHEKGRGTGELLLKRKDAAAWTVEQPKGNEVDPEKVRKLLDELSHLRVERFVAHKATPTEEQGMTTEKGALQVEVVVEVEKDKTEKFALTVGNLDGDRGYFATSKKLPGDIFDVRKDIFEGPKSKVGYFLK